MTKKFSTILFFIILISSKISSQCPCPLPITISYNWKPLICYSETISYNIPNAGFTSYYYGIPYIRYNPSIYYLWPQEVLVWVRVHEYGHAMTGSSDEFFVERWATNQLQVTDPNIVSVYIYWLETELPWGQYNSLMLAQNVRNARGY